MSTTVPAAWRRMLGCPKGAAMLEFALVLPLLLVLVGGLVEVGRNLIVYAAAERAVAAGVRALARTASPGCLATCPPATERVLTTVAARIRTETGIAPASLRVSGPTDGIVTLESELAVEPLAFGGWDFATRRFVVSHREQHVAP